MRGQHRVPEGSPAGLHRRFYTLKPRLFCLKDGGKLKDCIFCVEEEIEMKVTKEVCMVVVVMAALGVFFAGCTGDVENPVFSMPDSFAVTTLQAIQGTTGNVFEFSNTDDPNAEEIVFVVRASGVSSYPVYIVVRSGDDTPQDALMSGSIRMLNQAHSQTQLQTPWIRLAREGPNGYARLAEHTITIQMDTTTERPMLSSHTRHILFTAPSGGRVYITVCISFDQAAYRKFWDLMATGPKVIGGGTLPPTTGDGPSPEFTNWLNAPLDPSLGPAPPVITEVRYIHDGTEGSATEPDIAVVRKKQEALLTDTYGSDYHDDSALHHAVRMMDHMSEGYRQTGLLFKDFDTLLADRNKILFETTGMPYFTTTFIWHSLVLGFYANNPPDTSYGIALEYIRLNLTYPGSSEGQLLEHFGRSVSGGLIILENPWYVE